MSIPVQLGSVDGKFSQCCFHKVLWLICACFIPLFVSAQHISDTYLILNAKAGDPLYTTYAADPVRSALYGDKAYKMEYDAECFPVSFSSDQAGALFQVWRFNAVYVDKVQQYHKKPEVIVSFPDMVQLNYQPWPGIDVNQVFLVYSSSVAVVDIEITNKSDIKAEIDFYPVLEIPGDSIRVKSFSQQANAYIMQRGETKKRLVSNLADRYPYPIKWTDMLAMDSGIYSHGIYKGQLPDLYNSIKRDFYAEKNNHDSLNCLYSGDASLIVLHSRFQLLPCESRKVRYYRLVSSSLNKGDTLQSLLKTVKGINIEDFFAKNQLLFSNIPRLNLPSNADKITYLSAFNLVRGCILPPEGKTQHNYYVFSRNPLWGWGHGHQVLHESLSMLAYVWLDPESARESQRVYAGQQREDGLIAYRHGPRGLQDYPHKGMSTTSSPFYSWINYEIIKAHPNPEFLREMYHSGSLYTNWLLHNRDTDHDGLLEWGPYGIIENVRDWYNVVFQVSAERYLDVDKEDISDELECFDLSLMVVKEMKSLSAMAGMLNDKVGETYWALKADSLASLINKVHWDDATGFYYHVDKNTHEFRFMERDLKRMEIIGFLALWAGVASPDQAEILIKHLKNPQKFWRKNGIPTLSADDEWYNPNVDYCCKWNGPVWLLWNYLVYHGLKSYGYHSDATEVANRIIKAAQHQLSLNHNFWESYSPDYEVLNSPPNYIWDAILARVYIDEYFSKGEFKTEYK